MGQGQIDVWDLPFFAIFLLGGILSLGWIPTFEVPVAGWDLGGSLFAPEFDGVVVDIDIGTVLSLAGLIGAAATNKWSMSAASAASIWVVLLTVALIISPPLVPLMQAFMGYEVVGFVVLFVQSWGFMVVSYLG